MKTPSVSDIPNTPAGTAPADRFFRGRLQNFGVTTIVMVISFGFYYLGLFGTVDGPLNPERIGASLTGLGVEKRHVVFFFIGLFIATSTWNWILNGVCYLLGARMTCNAVDKGGSGPCGQTVKRTKRVSKRSGVQVTEYRCPHGHLRNEAHFHPVTKNAAGHTVWIGCLMIALIAAMTAI